MEADGSEHDIHPAIRGLKAVYRCNNIKRRTIERAVRHGALTLSQVAARTTATASECGGSGTPDVQELIAEVRGEMAPPPARKDEGKATVETPWWVRR
jgi:NAD(P)H-nitrite reductase large subunit